VIDPLPENIPLPSMMTLYRRDLMCLSEDEQQLLKIPFKCACVLCAKYPVLWEYVMDFIQEGNVQLIEARSNRDPTWSDTRFQAYVARSASGAMYQYLARTFDIYIPPTVRHRKIKKADAREMDRLDTLEHHLSWEQLFESWVVIPDQTNMLQAFNKAKRKQIDVFLSRLPTKEQTALRLYYGIGERVHPTSEIGKILQVKPDHAKILVNQAIKRIRNEENQPAKELQIKDRNERMQAVYQLWCEQGKRFQVREFARAVKCGDHIAHHFLQDRGVLSKSVVEVLKS